MVCHTPTNECYPCGGAHEYCKHCQRLNLENKCPVCRYVAPLTPRQLPADSSSANDHATWNPILVEDDFLLAQHENKNLDGKIERYSPAGRSELAVGRSDTVEDRDHYAYQAAVALVSSGITRHGKKYSMKQAKEWINVAYRHLLLEAAPLPGYPF